MRKLVILGGAVLTFTVFGCGSNPASRIAGPSPKAAPALALPPPVNLPFDPTDEIIGPPKYIELDGLEPVAER
ncbi:MAG: hypothetical protein L0196_01480 [candidate division Zixibacteria bacterium]|nr:hypothetical protein [candidate division Zixibacteria bacterium]